MSVSDPSPGHGPVIVAPVIRHLSGADPDRSIAFYRDVLGFDVRKDTEGNGAPTLAEAVYGPARIQLTTQDGAFDSTGEHRPRGSAIVFFPTDGVVALLESVRARGGRPSELEKVQWLKLRLFGIRDPDGHDLWFGQSLGSTMTVCPLTSGRYPVSIPESCSSATPSFGGR